ncbi:MAG: putative O-linked N-acetylglucosamine transferase, SPINDLY family [Candidatus Accumulibacter sp. SK-11]|nr:MAG: putative O-linked N-acetylglucosamine transferase, SPINDLY family [Candidatus Accumulibacter sp. SK-11]
MDLGGHTLDARPGIVARRPAPIQVNWLGYPGTSGSTAIDYLLADRFVVPPEHRQAYSEQLVYLPGSFWVSDSRIAPAAAVPSREDLGLPGDALLFCCLNHSYKINPQMFDVWMRVLRQIERSVLWLLATNHEVEVRLRQQAERRGVSPARIVFAPRLALSAHLARHSRADLFLDTLPFNAITTTSSALRAGVPVLTCAGRSFAARAAGSLLHAAGLSSLVTDDLAAYERKALELAGDPARIAALRRALGDRLRAGPLFDAARFRRAFGVLSRQRTG